MEMATGSLVNGLMLLIKLSAAAETSDLNCAEERGKVVDVDRLGCTWHHQLAGERGVGEKFAQEQRLKRHIIKIRSPV